MRLILLSLLLLAGCASNTWTSRVGNYSYDDALRDYGQPDNCETIETGQVCTWETDPDFDFEDRLVLIFDRDGYLTAAEERG